MHRTKEKTHVQKLGADPNPTARAAFTQFLDREGARWAKVLNEAKIRID